MPISAQSEKPNSPPHRERVPFTTLVPQVVVPALLVLSALLVYCGFFPDNADALFSSAQSWVVSHFDWFYTVAVTAFLLFLVLLAASRFGDIRLGPDDSVPEFSFVSWTAMLFAAGMGIGLIIAGLASVIIGTAIINNGRLWITAIAVVGYRMGESAVLVTMALIPSVIMVFYGVGWGVTAAILLARSCKAAEKRCCDTPSPSTRTSTDA